MTGKPQCSEASCIKVLEHVTEVWQPAIDIAARAELSIVWTGGSLRELVKRGKVESRWDGDVGIRYYRLVQP